jgi:hypothetical protein
MMDFLDRLPFRRRTRTGVAAVVEAVSREAPRAIDRLARYAPGLLERLGRPAPDLADAAVRKSPDVLEASLRAVGRSRAKPQVAPAVLLIGGAGVAFWWWTQWARGRAEADATARFDDRPE